MYITVRQIPSGFLGLSVEKRVRFEDFLLNLFQEITTVQSGKGKGGRGWKMLLLGGLCTEILGFADIFEPYKP